MAFHMHRDCAHVYMCRSRLRLHAAGPRQMRRRVVDERVIPDRLCWDLTLRTHHIGVRRSVAGSRTSALDAALCSVQPVTSSSLGTHKHV